LGVVVVLVVVVAGWVGYEVGMGSWRHGWEARWLRHVW
jgi:hypothetical protein